MSYHDDSSKVYTQEPPFGKASYAKISRTVMNPKGRPTRPATQDLMQISEAMWELAQRCWDHFPEQRPDVSAVAKRLEVIVTGEHAEEVPKAYALLPAAGTHQFTTEANCHNGRRGRRGRTTGLQCRQGSGSGAGALPSPHSGTETRKSCGSSCSCETDLNHPYLSAQYTIACSGNAVRV